MGFTVTRLYMHILSFESTLLNIPLISSLSTPTPLVHFIVLISLSFTFRLFIYLLFSFHTSNKHVATVFLCLAYLA
jgi:hypothetical protein